MPRDATKYPRAVLQTKCPRCEVGPGALCRMPGGNILYTPHLERRHATVEEKVMDTSWITDETRSEDLPLSVRAANCMRHNNLRTVGEIRRSSDRAIMRFPNMGRTSLRELRDLVGYAPGNAPEDQTRTQRRPFALYVNESPERKIYGGFRTRAEAEDWARANLDPAEIRWFSAPFMVVRRPRSS